VSQHPLSLLCLCLQVGAHLVKDVFSNFVATPLVGKAQDAALEATGLDGLAGKVCAERSSCPGGGLGPAWQQHCTRKQHEC
jgi:hypothetical protein